MIAYFCIMIAYFCIIITYFCIIRAYLCIIRACFCIMMAYLCIMIAYFKPYILKYLKNIFLNMPYRKGGCPQLLLLSRNAHVSINDGIGKEPHSLQCLETTNSTILSSESFFCFDANDSVTSFKKGEKNMHE